MGPALDHILEPGKLLEESWFFGNSLHRKSPGNKIMSRSMSDPCSSSSNFNPETLHGKSFEETYASIHKFPVNDDATVIGRSHPVAVGKTLSGSLPRRAPSLPNCVGTDEIQEEEEVEFSMGKLIRQASLNNSDTALGRTNSRTNDQASKMGSLRCGRPINQIRTQKSLSCLESASIDLDRKFLIDNIVEIEEEEEEAREKNQAQRLYRCQTGVPKWAAEMPAEDMKARLKFWARAVASNVRQEC